MNSTPSASTLGLDLFVVHPFLNLLPGFLFGGFLSSTLGEEDFTVVKTSGNSPRLANPCGNHVRNRGPLFLKTDKYASTGARSIDRNRCCMRCVNAWPGQCRLRGLRRRPGRRAPAIDGVGRGSDSSDWTPTRGRQPRRRARHAEVAVRPQLTTTRSSRRPATVVSLGNGHDRQRPCRARCVELRVNQIELYKSVGDPDLVADALRPGLSHRHPRHRPHPYGHRIRNHHQRLASVRRPGIRHLLGSQRVAVEPQSASTNAWNLEGESVPDRERHRGGGWLPFMAYSVRATLFEEALQRLPSSISTGSTRFAIGVEGRLRHTARSDCL